MAQQQYGGRELGGLAGQMAAILARRQQQERAAQIQQQQQLIQQQEAKEAAETMFNRQVKIAEMQFERQKFAQEQQTKRAEAAQKAIAERQATTQEAIGARTRETQEAVGERLTQQIWASAKAAEEKYRAQEALQKKRYDELKSMLDKRLKHTATETQKTRVFQDKLSLRKHRYLTEKEQAKREWNEKLLLYKDVWAKAKDATARSKARQDALKEIERAIDRRFGWLLEELRVEGDTEKLAALEAEMRQYRAELEDRLLAEMPPEPAPEPAKPVKTKSTDAEAWLEVVKQIRELKK